MVGEDDAHLRCRTLGRENLRLRKPLLNRASNCERGDHGEATRRNCVAPDVSECDAKECQPVRTTIRKHGSNDFAIAGHGLTARREGMSDIGLIDDDRAREFCSLLVSLAHELTIC